MRALEPISGIFYYDAIIIFLGCEVGKGDDGDEIENLVANFTHREVWANKQETYWKSPSFGEKVSLTNLDWKKVKPK